MSPFNLNFTSRRKKNCIYSRALVGTFYTHLNHESFLYILPHNILLKFPSCLCPFICSTQNLTLSSVYCASELYLPSDRRILMSTFADRGRRVASSTDSHMAVNLGFLDIEPLFFHSSSSSVIPMDPVPDPLLLRKSGSAGK
jgi:hypothetical protein